MKPSIFFLLFLFSCCSAELDTEWWKHTIIYEILPYSFKDSNGDGVGDLKGITSKLDHFVDMKVETLHLTPIYNSTFLDMGYDITDYCKIHPQFGTMDDFDELIREMNKRDMKLILDLVFNHSGHKHPWFKKSVENVSPYRNLYVWKDASGFDEETNEPIPPNKWRSVFGGSAWKWNEKRKQFYLHQFMEEQPDFNLNNATLKKELKKIIKFWLDRGVSGFRLDAAIFYFEDKYFRDDDNQLRQYNQEENYELVHEFRLYLDEYNRQNGGNERIFLAEAHSDDHYVLRFYGTEDYPVAHLPYAFQMEATYSEINADQLNNLIEPWLKSIPENAVAAWMTQDHDGTRIGSRIRPEYSDLLTMISMMLPGTVGVYYGQEIAMTNGHIQEHEKKDISGGGSRDPTRLIMQWDDSLNAGFTKNRTPYLPPSHDFLTKNVKYQSMQDISHYSMFKDLSKLRQGDIFKYGDFEKFIPSEFIYVFTRSYKNQKLVIVVNFDGSPSRVNLMPILSEIPQYGVIGAASVNAGYKSGFKLDENFWNGFVMNARSSIVIQLHFWKNSPSKGNFSEEKPSKFRYIVTDQYGKTKDVKLENGIVQVNGKVVHIDSEPTTKFTFDQYNIYADGEPIYNLNGLENQNIIQTTSSPQVPSKQGTPVTAWQTENHENYTEFRIPANGKFVKVTTEDGIVTVDGNEVYTAPDPNTKFTVKSKKIYANGTPIYDVLKNEKISLPTTSTLQSENPENYTEFKIPANGKFVKVTTEDGIVTVDGNEVYTAPDPNTKFTVKSKKIYANGTPIYDVVKSKIISPPDTQPTDQAGNQTEFDIPVNGKLVNVKIVDGFVQVNGNVVYIATDSITQLTVKNTKIYADGKPIYNLNGMVHINHKKSFAPPQESNDDEIVQDVVVRGKSLHIQIQDGVAKVNGKVVYTAPYPTAYIYVDGNNIYADEVSVYDLAEYVKRSRI